MPWPKEKLARWRKANRAHVNATKMAYYKSHPEYRARALLTARRHRFLKTYGITLEQYATILKRQRGHCALCLRRPGKRWLCIDHDHQTGRVRGLLCLQHNTALGTLGDSIAGLRRAIRYLARRLE